LTVQTVAATVLKETVSAAANTNAAQESLSRATRGKKRDEPTADAVGSSEARYFRG
jgi:hypothetical protein